MLPELRAVAVFLLAWYAATFSLAASAILSSLFRTLRKRIPLYRCPLSTFSRMLSQAGSVDEHIVSPISRTGFSNTSRKNGGKEKGKGKPR